MTVQIPFIKTRRTPVLQYETPVWIFDEANRRGTSEENAHLERPYDRLDPKRRFAISQTPVCYLDKTEINLISLKRPFPELPNSRFHVKRPFHLQETPVCETLCRK